MTAAELLFDDAGPVGVGQEDVVVVGQEPGRRVGVGIGARGPGEIEELGAPLVAEDAQARPQALDALLAPLEPRPDLHVPDAGRAETAQVAQQHPIGRARAL